MLQGLQRVLQIDELRDKIAITFLLLAVCRIGGFIPVPGVNGELAVTYFRQMTGGTQNLFQLVDVFSGGAFSQMTVIALGVVPYISASIMMQLFTSLIPSLQREMKENPQVGKRKIGKYTRLLTVLLAVIQSLVYSKFAMRMNLSTPGIVNSELISIEFLGIPILFYLLFIVTMTTGTVFLMWVGEQITEKGIGNGMSLIICLGIVSSLPSAIGLIVQQLNLSSQEPGQMNFAMVMLLLALFVFITLGTILMLQGTRKIPLQHARRVIGRKETQGGTSYIPLKINYAGVIPVIFASSVLMFPATIGTFLGQGNWIGTIAGWISPGSIPYTITFVSLIIFFTYFWTATQFHPDQIASDMKKNGAFIPGIRQGKPTRDYLESSMNRITIIGALFLALIAILPSIIGVFLGLPPMISYFFGGTSLLILVGVVLDTMKQVESHLLMKRYDGFLKTRKVRGR